MRSAPSNSRLQRLVRHMSANPTAGAASPSTILVENPAPHMTRLVLNREKKLNALNLDMVREMTPVLKGLGPNRVLLMEGAGSKAFCAGGDVVSLWQELAALNRPGPLCRDFFWEEYRLDNYLAEIKAKKNVVQVSVWNGIVMGGGVGISVHGPIRIATERTIFAMPETSIGLFPDVGVTYTLARLPIGRDVGLYLALTGAKIGAHDCLASGLATHYLNSSKLPLLRERLAKFEPAPGADGDAHVKVISEMIKEIGKGDVPLVPDNGIERNREYIRTIFMSPTLRHIEEQQLPRYAAPTLPQIPTGVVEWARQAGKGLIDGSNISKVVTMQAMIKAAMPSTTLRDVFVTDYRLAQRLVVKEPKKSDFYEGIRARLVEKDPDPKFAEIRVIDLERELKKKVLEPFFSPLVKGPVGVQGFHELGDLTFIESDDEP